MSPGSKETWDSSCSSRVGGGAQGRAQGRGQGAKGQRWFSGIRVASRGLWGPWSVGAGGASNHLPSPNQQHYLCLIFPPLARPGKEPREGPRFWKGRPGLDCK